MLYVYLIRERVEKCIFIGTNNLRSAHLSEGWEAGVLYIYVNRIRAQNCMCIGTNKLRTAYLST